jgi:hypothetical protein
LTINADSYEVRYRGAAGQVVTLSVSIPNPAPPDAKSTQRILTFRGDSRAAYQDQDRTDPSSRQWILWNEPGRWAGDPSAANSARSDTVPYFLDATGVTPDGFWQYASSLTAVPVSAAPPVEGTVTVTPDSGLVDGQQVKVGLSGFRPWERVRLSECWSAELASNEGCGPQAAQQPFVDLDGAGAGSTMFAVSSTAYLKPYNTTATEACSGGCVIVASRGVDGQPPGRAVLHFR